MKKVCSIFFFTCLTWLVSCNEDLTENSAIRRIINESDFNVELEIFGDELIYTARIESGDTIDIEGFCTSGVIVECNLGWRGSIAFAKIIFDDDQVLNFGLPNENEKFINADPKGGYGYTRSDVDGIQIYTYRITQEDHEKAEVSILVLWANKIRIT